MTLAAQLSLRTYLISPAAEEPVSETHYVSDVRDCCVHCDTVCQSECTMTHQHSTELVHC
jgi:hypothetical protein